MKRALILIAALGLALLAGILVSRPFRDLRPVVSVLPEFDSVTFIPFVEGVVQFPSRSRAGNAIRATTKRHFGDFLG